MTSRERLALGALALVIAISGAWWALALWPLPPDAPAWLERTRFVCFGATRDTLPSAAGWTVLIGEPVAMIAALGVVWSRELAGGIRALVARAPGRLAAGLTVMLVVAGLGAAGVRVATARPADAFDPEAGGLEPVTMAQALDVPAPPLGLVNQSGDTTHLAAFRGRTVIVAFAFAHCETVCPLIVRDALAAQQRLLPRPVLVVVTLDPWRDTPSRLPEIARYWRLGDDAYVLSGPETSVRLLLDTWGVARAREETTGEITHASTVFLVDGAGRLRWQVPARTSAIVDLAASLQEERSTGRR